MTAAPQARRAWSDLVALMGSQVLGAVVSVVGIAITVRALGTDGYGRVALLLGIAAFVFTFGSNWSTGAVVRFGAAARAEGESMAPVFWTRLALSVFSSAVLAGLVAIAWKPLRAFSGAPDDALPIVLALAFVSALLGHAGGVMQATSALRGLAATRPVERLAYLALIGAPLLAGSPLGVTMVLWANLGARALATLVTLAVLPRSAWLPPTVDPALLRRMFVYALPTIFAFASGYVFDWVDVFFLRVWIGFEAVGVYQAGYQTMLFASALLVSLSTLAFPAVVRFRSTGRDDVTRSYLDRVVPITTLAWSSALAWGIALSPELLPIFLGASFGGADPVLRLLLVGTALECVTALTTGVAAAYDQTGKAAATHVAMTVLNIALNIVLIPVIGIAGPAVSTAAAYGLGAVAYSSFTRRRLGLPGWSGRAFAGIVPALIALGLSFAVGDAPVRLVLLAGALAVTLVFVRATGAVSERDLELFGRLGVPRALTSVARLLVPGAGPHGPEVPPAARRLVELARSGPGEWDTPDYYLSRTRDVLAALPYLPELAGHVVVDVGGSSGFQAALFQDAGARAVCVDMPAGHGRRELALGALRRLGAALDRVPPEGVFGDAGRLPFRTGAVDVAFSSYTLEHVPSRSRALAEIRRILRPDGVAIVVVPAAFERIYNFREFPRRHGNYAHWFEEVMAQLPARWVADVHAAGLDVVDWFPTRFGFCELPFATLDAQYGWFAPLVRAASRSGFGRHLGLNVCIVARPGGRVVPPAGEPRTAAPGGTGVPERRWLRTALRRTHVVLMSVPGLVVLALSSAFVGLVALVALLSDGRTAGRPRA